MVNEQLFRAVSVNYKADNEKATFLGWGVSDGSTVGIIEYEDGTVELLGVDEFKFLKPITS